MHLNLNLNLKLKLIKPIIKKSKINVLLQFIIKL